MPDPFIALCLADRAPTGGLASWLAPGKMPDFDVVICLGDLDYYALKELQLLNQPRMGVLGNHCGDYFEDLGIHDMHRFRGQWRGWPFRGIEGSPVYKKAHISIPIFKSTAFCKNTEKSRLMRSCSPTARHWAAMIMKMQLIGAGHQCAHGHIKPSPS